MPALLSNVSNPLLAATISANSVRAAFNTACPKIASRTGLGRVVLSGGFTGFADADLDLEIVNAATATLRISEPTFIGAGIGSITAISADAGAVAERIDITLTDAGTVTKPAELEFFGVRLKARSAIVGGAGNALFITVDTANLVVSATDWSTIEDMAKDSLDLKGPQYTWGSLPLLGDGTLNPNTVRFTFGDDPTVYREYSAFENGETVFKLDRTLLADVKKGTPLKQVTGYYEVTITYGATSEIYSNIITLYDFISQVKASSNLLEIDGVVINDKTPGGMAMDEFPLRTGAYALATSCSSEIGSALSNVIVATDCPGQLVQIKCKDNTIVGAEKWNVTAPSEGGLIGEATSGLEFSSSHFSFTIPKIIPENPSSVGMKLGVKSITFAAREEKDQDIQICVDAPTCGINSKAKTITCIYTQKPSETCKCEDVSYEGKLNSDCLGIKVDEGVNSMDSNLSTLLLMLYSWRKSWMRANTSINTTTVRSAYYDQSLCDEITDIFSKCALDVYASSTARTEWTSRFNEMVTDLTALATSTISTMGGVSSWSGETAYSDGQLVTPPEALFNGHQYLIFGCVTSSGSNYFWGNATSGPGGPESWPTDGSASREEWYDQSSDTSYTLNYRDLGNPATGDIAVEVTSGALRTDIKDFVRRYAAAMDYCRVLADIIPKGKASGTGGDCWQPRNDEYFWKVSDGAQQYLPAYTNVVYHSCIGKMDGSEVTCTKEFAFVIKVNEACSGSLKVGDTVELEITGENTGNKSYQVGDVYLLPIIAGAPRYLAGGVTGNDTLTWSVRGSVSGALTPLSFSGDESDDYALHDLHFTLARGAVPFVLNDQFSFSVEGGQFRYRFDGGAWSAAHDIPLTPISLGNGLSAEFIAGVDTSFVAGDLFSWRVLQPYGPQNTRQPGYRQYEWQGAGCTLVFDTGISTPIHGFAVGLHRLPSTATLLLDGLDGSDAVLWSETLAWRPGVIASLFETRIAVKLRLTLGNALGGGIGWLWAGDPLSFRHPPSDMTLTRNWQTANSRYLGAGAGGSLTWDGNSSFLYQPEIDELLELLDYAKAHHDQPLILIPNSVFPGEARLVRFDGDSFEWSEWFRFQVQDDSTEDYRVIGTHTLPFVGVVA